jgi:hypothetical protein
MGTVVRFLTFSLAATKKQRRQRRLFGQTHRAPENDSDFGAQISSNICDIIIAERQQLMSE